LIGAVVPGKPKEQSKEDYEAFLAEKVYPLPGAVEAADC